jgi:aminomuconate-semialdehyde/2-hydroxymuconate-6-semialdehyde dehydrogenase
VFNVVQGYGSKVGAAIVSHPQVPTISFTGGTATGREIAKASAPQFKKVALEMGGKNPNIIFADADLDEALKTTLRSSFENQGEICLCGSRILVERKVYSAFTERLVAATGKLKVGDPFEASTDQGALISKAHLEKVLSYIRLAKEEGGRILCGGNQPTNIPERCRNGFFLQPTVIVDLPVNCRTNQEEIFGPVVTVSAFENEEEAIAQANATPFGLSASLWTRDLDRAHRVAEQIQRGTIWVSGWLVRDLRTPFGGMKQSGLGREGGLEALHFFTEPKNVCVKYDSKS